MPTVPSEHADERMARSTDALRRIQRCAMTLYVSERTMTDTDPDDIVVAWRYTILQAAGYPEDYARGLAFNPDVDLHRACSLLANGCAPEVAIEILT